ncbi:hypothetical protein L2E82_44812 [Cichorium intybus]|uniref:Uncharacterized protein n=1 Tax=Cichorium intybus TaxID=13427 RepID=A0ACB8ZR54_CICIN|nr:hypothetical protein L2E82_44812 [Cichorium intybus]
MRNNNAAVQAPTKQQNRANLMQMKLIGQSHPTGLTNNILNLFEPRPPLEYKPAPEKRKCPPYTVEKGETPGQSRARIHRLRLEEGARKAAEELQKCNFFSELIDSRRMIENLQSWKERCASFVSPESDFTQKILRKVNEKIGLEGQEETRKAFDIMLSYVGSDIASVHVWTKYINFLKSLPAETPQEE